MSGLSGPIQSQELTDRFLGLVLIGPIDSTYVVGGGCA